MLKSDADAAAFHAERMLVVAPHPDDETLGCGGLIAKLIVGGTRVHTLFVTDGGASHPPSPLWPRKRLVREREQEAAEALRCLGAGSHPRTFLRLTDAAMPKRGSRDWVEAVDRVLDLLSEFDPDLVLLPWRRDPHCDHRDSFSLVSVVLDASSTCTAHRLEYAIWLDEIGSGPDFPRCGEMKTLELDIAAEIEMKRAALEVHRTQLGAIAAEAPGGFSLSAATVGRLVTPVEKYYRQCV